MDINNLNTGEKVAGISGIVLILVMIILPWFTFDVSFGDDGANAFQSFALIDWVLLLAAAAGIGLAVVAAMQSDIDLPVPLSAIVAGLGILAVVLVIFRIISPPDFGLGDVEVFGQELDADAGRGIGVFVGLLAAAGVAIGGWMAMQEEGASFTDVGGGGAAPPPGGGGAAPPPQQQQPPAAPPPPQEQAPPPPQPPQQPPQQ
jgi:hypothetical protein